MKKNLLTALTASLFFIATAQAHQMPNSGGQSQGTSPNASANSGANANMNRQPDMDTLVHQGHAGSYYGGNVKVSDGALPWDPILINVVCNGETRHTTATDPKGNFLIAPKQADAAANSAASAGPGDAQNKALAQFVGCNVQAALPGFDSNSLTIANRNLTDDPNIGTITLKPAESAVGSSVSATTAAAPKDAVKAFEKARSEWIENKPDKAQKDLQKAVQIDPQFAEAWYQLGKLQEVQKSPDAANSFNKAVAADPKFVPPYEHLVSTAAQAEKWQEVLDNTNKELQLNPAGSPRLFYYNAVANMKLGKTDAAQASVEKAIAADPNHTEPNAQQLLAVILANKQDLSGALEHLRIAVKYMPPGPNADLVKKQIAQLESATQSNPSK
ncbi:MAG TPA: tetratricopeptide repeat protein [Candidatus Sulfotelmatobacter sp.]|nr:tetratricopeptide repeat protein [Candidatus Sulfotelmatobacter sp.]